LFMTQKKPVVFITRPIPQNGIAMLKKHFTVRLRKVNSPIPKKELEKEIQNCTALLTILTDKIDGKIMDLNPNLKVISNFAVGFDNIDISAASKRGIAVGNTPGVLTQSTAEHTLALILALMKRIVEGQKIMERNAFCGWGPLYMLGKELYKKTIGVVGFGRIGVRLAEIAYYGFGCNILYDNPSVNKKMEHAIHAKHVKLATLLKKADVVSLHVPLLPHTHHLIGKKELSLMKKTAYLINTARGAVVDEKALLSALKKGQIAGAGLDVFECEPSRTAGLEKLNNVVMVPHTGSATVEAREGMAQVAAQNIIGILKKGAKPVSIVNA